VLRVHAGDAILTNNWHTNEVLSHARNNFEGYTFAMRTLEAWGAMIENDRRAYYTAAAACGSWTWSPPQAEGAAVRFHAQQEVAYVCGAFCSSTIRRKSRIADVCIARPRLRRFRHRLYLHRQ